jgi:phospholipid/cholesterol/gamma-HCH transport system permease protein
MEAAMKRDSGTLDVSVSDQKDRLDVRLKGSLESSDLEDARRVIKRLPPLKGRTVELSLDPQPLKTRGTVVLDRICRLVEDAGGKVVVNPADGEMKSALASYAAPKERPKPLPQEDFIDRVARFEAATGESVIRYLLLFRQTLGFTFGGIFRRNRFDFDDFLLALIKWGVGAVPLVILISGLVGAILALQAGPFFERYGQENLVAQLVALSMLRDVGPLLTAILVAGRSGSSLAAEIGTMKVAEEIDAITVMGAQPVRVLVAPRFLGLVCALPCLVILSDLVGILGGMIVSRIALEIPTAIYYDQTLKGLEMKDVVGGLVKALAYAIVIVTISGHQGFVTTGGATGVGRNTTRSVVLSILWIIVMDALITWVIYMMRL